MAKKIAKLEVIASGSKPDVDSDFNTTVREKTITHVAEVYGHDNVSNIGTVGSLKAKAAFKEMCRIYNISFAQSNKIASLVPPPIEGVMCSFDDIYNPNSDRYVEASDFREAVSGPEWEPIIKAARNIEGRTKSSGVHACGILMSSEPLQNVIPLTVRQKDGTVVTQWEYPDCESLGLIKMDFLGLDTVDLVQHTIENIIKNGKTPPNMMEIVHGDMDDPEVYKLFQEGHTIGIFQFGSEMVRNLLLLTKPTEFSDLPAITSVARPGPMRMQSHTKYADRKNGREEVDFIHPDFKGTQMEEILGKTYGLCIPAGTLILDSSTGLYTPIEKMTANKSTTPSYNHTTGLFEDKKVNNVVATGKKQIIEFAFDNDKALSVSETHPVLTARGYVAAKEIKTDDVLAVRENEELVYKEISEIKYTGIEECYDIEVADNHNFIVDGVVVHNCIYQEQVQKIANEVAGMTLQEGDDLRRAMGKKKKKVMDAMRPKFYEGAMAKGISEGAVDALWNTLEPFSKYGFNKCLHGRTLVALPDGQGKASIQDLYNDFTNGKDVEILSMFENGEIRPHKVSKIVQTGVKPLYKVKTKNGRTVKITKEHRLLTPDGYGSIEDGVLRVGNELIVDAEWTKRLSAKTLKTRQEIMSKVNKTTSQREKARQRMIAYQQTLSFEDRSAHQQQIQMNNPSRNDSAISSMHARLKELWRTDKEWQEQTLTSFENVRTSTAGIRKGFGVPTVLSDGRVADSIAEAAAAEYLISRGVDFELHKKFSSVNGRMKVADFYANGLYFEMDGLRRGREYFVKEKYGEEIPFVYLTPQNFGDEIDNALMMHHIENGDEIVEIIEPKILANGSVLREMTYDIEMETTGPANFVANGIVSHNSHAVAYAMNSYQSAFLKVHYPVEFMSALIAQHVGDKDKTLAHLREANRMGVKVGTVDINLSETRVAPNYDKKSVPDIDIFFGLSGIKSVSENMAEIIVEEREKNGKYSSVEDLIQRCYSLGVNKKQIYENLALAGAFDNLGVSRKAVYENITNLMDTTKTKDNKGDSLFDAFEVEDSSLDVDLTGEDYPFLDKIKKEAGMIGLYLTAHPTDKIKSMMRKDGVSNIASLLKAGRFTKTNIITSILDIDVKRMKTGAKFITLNLDDGTGFLTAKVDRNAAKNIDKYLAQEKIKQIYTSGKGTITDELVEEATDENFTPMKELEKYNVYNMKISFRPGKDDDQSYVARVDEITPLELANDGTLPIRIRLKHTSQNSEKIAKLKRSLPASLGKKIPGDSAIHMAVYKEDEIVIDEEQLYSAAQSRFVEGEEQMWPPKTDKRKRQATPQQIANALNTLEYSDTGYTTQKSQKVEQIIEKYVGYGAYDFGFLNPDHVDEY